MRQRSDGNAPPLRSILRVLAEICFFPNFLTLRVEGLSQCSVEFRFFFPCNGTSTFQRFNSFRKILHDIQLLALFLPVVETLGLSWGEREAVAAVLSSLRYSFRLFLLNRIVCSNSNRLDNRHNLEIFAQSVLNQPGELRKALRCLR